MQVYTTQSARSRDHAPQNHEGTPIVIEGGKTSGFAQYRNGRLEWNRRDQAPLYKWPGPGPCFDKGAHARAKQLGIEVVRIRYPKTDTEYLAPFQAIEEHGIEFDYGWGRQICLPFKYWVKVAPDGTVTQPETQQPSSTIQCQLFAMDEQRRAYP